ncbi:uncharacterized protein LOC105828720 [Monomorium pharaonis]|uniref:uncharacterized protein LOC105828720 n=1 Tax=Monomorium pharaonis TaxID=307658 RepID=UPI001746BD8C|nr:uncharacterized protein LOC105828720 [Monomorium pharaonis]
MKLEESLSLIQKEFFDFRWDPAGNVAQHTSKLEGMVNKIKTLEGEIPASMLITRILSTLPQKFSHFHSAWDSTDDAKRTIENLTARLMMKEMRLKVIQKAKRQYKERGATRVVNHKTKNCRGYYNCGSFKKNYPKQGEHKKNEDTSSASTAQAFAGSTERTKTEDYWLLDSAARAIRMTNERDWFFEYQFSEPLKVYIGNGKKVPALGQDNIKIETRVNGKWSQGIVTSSFMKE